ncbi:MAG: hypothetical protein ACR2QH_09270 [Geminicoccaceae bacterium]
MDQGKTEKGAISRDKLFADLAESSERMKHYEKARKESFNILDKIIAGVGVMFFVIPLLTQTSSAFTITSAAISIGSAMLLFAYRSSRD